MNKQKDNNLIWIIGIVLLLGLLVGWWSNKWYYNSKPSTIDLKKEQYITAQQKCGTRNVLTIVDDEEDFKRFDCQDWAEATKSGVTER